MNGSNLIHPYPVDGLSFALGNTGGGDLNDVATASAKIIFFAADDPNGSGAKGGDIFMGSTLKLGYGGTTGGTITTNDAAEALTITTSTTGAIDIGTNSTARTITIGSTNAESGLVLYGGNDWSVSAAGLTVLGLTANSFTFTPGSGVGLVYAGTTRPTRKVSLTPEYPGATLTGAGIGTMTSDFCEQGFSANITDTNPSACESGQIHNYYTWTSTSGSNTYSIYVRWRVPDNFSATGWTVAGTITNPITVWGRRSDSTDGTVTVTLYDTVGTQETSTQVAGANSTWTQTSLEATEYEGTYTAGSYITLKIDLQVTGTDTAMVGEIDIEYLSTN
jgi:hypothetical protein